MLAVCVLFPPLCSAIRPALLGSLHVVGLAPCGLLPTGERGSSGEGGSSEEEDEDLLSSELVWKIGYWSSNGLVIKTSSFLLEID